MNINIYKLPGGYEIDFEKGILTVTQDEGKSVCVPLSRFSLIDLSEKLASFSGDENRPTYYARQISNRAGAAVAANCVKSMVKAKTIALRTKALQAALLELQRLPHPVDAADGFAKGFSFMVENSMVFYRTIKKATG